MAATPPPEQPRSYSPPNMPLDVARLPIPGNAEFALWLVVSVLDLLLCWISKHLTIRDFLYTWTVITFAYLFSRGIAKASRVLEQ